MVTISSTKGRKVNCSKKGAKVTNRKRTSTSKKGADHCAQKSKDRRTTESPGKKRKGRSTTESHGKKKKGKRGVGKDRSVVSV